MMSDDIETEESEDIADTQGIENRYKVPFPLLRPLSWGLQILGTYPGTTIEGSHIPGSHPNGVAARPEGTYISATMGGDVLLSSSDADELVDLGWWSEQFGQYWLIRTS